MRTNTRIEQLKEAGLPVSAAQFHTAVNNSDRIPDTEFNIASPKSNRQVEMWITALGLLCLHKDEYFIVPTANVVRMS